MTAAWPVEIDAAFGCELWSGALTPNGYPRMGDRSSAHRVAYERERGPIAIGLVLDHLCRRPRCVAVEHLEPVTKDENERRKSMRYRLQRARCARGHALNETTRIVTPEMGVLCRTCRSAHA
jgi:hypothetical protein